MRNLTCVFAALLMLTLAVPACATESTSKDKVDTNVVKTHKPPAKKHVAGKTKKDNAKKDAQPKAGDFIAI